MGCAYGIEVMLHTPANLLLGAFGDTKKVERFFQSLKFAFGFAVEINETNLFDDIVLPYPSYLERYDFNSGSAAHSIPPCGQHDFHWQLRQPVVELPGQSDIRRRSWPNSATVSASSATCTGCSATPTC